MRNFREFKIWQLGMEIVKDVYRLAEKIPEKERFGLISQMTRSAVSIPSNIAEGSGRGTNNDTKRFFEIALGSAFELETQLLIVQDIYINDDSLINELFQKLNEEQKMLNGFIKKLTPKT